MKRALAIRRALAGLLLLTGACTRDVELLPGRAGAPPGDAAGDGAAGDAGAGPACLGLGEPIRLDVRGTEECAGAVAARAHRYALCSCAGLDAPQPLRTDSFDSTGLLPGGVGAAAVGAGASVSAAGALTIGGALYAAGSADLSGGAGVAESLRLGGELAAEAVPVEVGGDAFVGGDVSGPVAVTGTLHVPLGSTVEPEVAAAAVVREAVIVPDPCACATLAHPDPAALAAATAARNDDAAIGLASDALGVVVAPTALDLPCGRFYLTAIDAAAPVTLRVHGRALLAVAGDVALRGDLAVTLDPGAELDLVVGGSITATGERVLGAPAAPARLRLWVGGEVTLEGRTTVGAVVHAPRGRVSAPQGAELSGSLLAGEITAGAVTVHYDLAILSGGVVCGVPASPAVH
ncbi:MAG TPA: hypothetical protein VGQ83_31440 [Polyangia bacterium]